MKNEINILYLKDVGGFLKNEQINYIVTNIGNEINIQKIPAIFNYHLATLYNYLAYDFDNLSSINKEKYKVKQQKFIFNSRNYINKSKQYIKKRK